MRKTISLILAMILLLSLPRNIFSEETPNIKPSSHLLLSNYHQLIDGKYIGLVTNQKGLRSEDHNLIDSLSEYPKASLKAIYTLEQDASLTHPSLNIPVYSLSEETPRPTPEMLQDVDVLIFDLQELEENVNTYISALNDGLIAAKQNNKSFIVLDQPNLLNKEVMEGFLGGEILPIAQDMTIGEWAQYLNQKIEADLTVIPLEEQPPPPIPQDTGKTGVSTVQLEGGLLIGSKSYVPLRTVLQEFGYEIGWNPQTKQVSAEKPGKIVVIETAVLPMKVWVNEKPIISKDVIPLIKSGTTYIPAQFIPWLEKSQQKTIGNQVEITAAHLIIKVSIKVHKTAYLTFDDGPSTLTPQVLDILKEHGAKATFFVIGRNIKGYESLLKRAVAEGHSIGNHSYSHNYDVIYHDVNSFFKDIEKAQMTIEQVTGSRPTVFRFPGGSNNSVSKKAQDPKVYGKQKWIMNDLVKEVPNQGFQYFDWNVSIGDASAQGYTADSALQKVQEGIKGKKEVVVLSHDSKPKLNTVKALPGIIQLLKKEGYSFETLDRTVEGFTFIE